MSAAWQSAKAIQAEQSLPQEAQVVIEDDPYTFLWDQINLETKTVHLVRRGHPEDHEPAWVSKWVDLEGVVTLENMTLAMARHTNVDLHLVNDAADILSKLGNG